MPVHPFSADTVVSFFFFGCKHRLLLALYLLRGGLLEGFVRGNMGDRSCQVLCGSENDFTPWFSHTDFN